MLTLLCYLAPSPCPPLEDTSAVDYVAEEEEEPQVAADAPQIVEVAQQVQQVRAQTAERGVQLTIIEHYFADQDLVTAGKAPDGWAMPPLYRYAEPGAPASFIPSASTGLVTTSATPPL